jgi:pimeloyl-ACP methyl ester carboxylesterase
MPGARRIRIGSQDFLKQLACNSFLVVKRGGAALLCAWILSGVEASSLHGQTLVAQTYHPARTLPLTKFYDTPEPLPAGKPGELIRSEDTDDYRLSYQVSTVRILYHSRSPQGEDLAVSGVVLLPEGTPPAGGWPIVAWGHDFSGSARQCAPSLVKNLGQGTLLSMYASLGYAVVATDYAGLGTNFPYADLDSKSHAWDVIYAVRAARAALPQLGNKWIAVGYGQGAAVAVGVAESAGEAADTNYLGSIAVSGLAEPEEFFAHVVDAGTDYAAFRSLAMGIKAVYPEFRVEDMLTEKGMKWSQSLRDTCEANAGTELDGKALLNPGWRSNRYVKAFFARNTLGETPAHGPLMVVSGEADGSLPVSLMTKVVARLCAKKDRVLLVKYPGLSGSAALSNSVSEQASWLRARFGGLPAPGNCP